MPHTPRPFYRAPRRTWFVAIGKKQHPLGKHPDGLPEPRKGRDGSWIAPPEILQAFHRTMAGADGAEAGEPTPCAGADSAPYVAVVFDELVGWLRKRVEEGNQELRTLDWYADYLTSFLEQLRGPESPRLQLPTVTVDQLRPCHVRGWVDAKPDWKTGRRGAVVAVQRALNWAAKSGRLAAVGGRPGGGRGHGVGAGQPPRHDHDLAALRPLHRQGRPPPRGGVQVSGA